MTVFFRPLFLTLLFLAAFVPSASVVQAAETGAVVLMYHRFGEGDYPSTNIRLDQFEAQIEELKAGGYSVVPLSDVVAAQSGGRALPEKAVAITMDDAYLSIYTEAWPRLKEAGFPFTVFTSTEAVDRATSGAYKRYMTWDQIRELKDAGVEIGHHSHTHRHMPAASAETNKQEMAEATARFEKELGLAPTLFAYPYGEAGAAVASVVKDAGFPAAFGQHSGPIGAGDDPYNLPRFALNEEYGDIERFRLVINTHALPVSDVEPKDMVVTEAANPPAIGFTLTKDMGNLAGLSCYVSGEGKVTIENIGNVRIEIRPSQAFAQGRTRLNCTMPDDGDHWYWFGRLFYVP